MTGRRGGSYGVDVEDVLKGDGEHDSDGRTAVELEDVGWGKDLEEVRWCRGQRAKRYGWTGMGIGGEGPGS